MASKLPESYSGERIQAVIPGTVISRSVTSSSAQSSAIPAGVSVVVLSSTTNCYVEFGTNPTASTSTFYLPAGVLFPIGIPKDNQISGDYKVAVIRASADGTLSILPGATA